MALLSCSWLATKDVWYLVQGMGLHGIPMGNMSNQQLMQMQLHGMDLQRMGMGLTGVPLHSDSMC